MAPPHPGRVRVVGAAGGCRCANAAAASGRPGVAAAWAWTAVADAACQHTVRATQPVGRMSAPLPRRWIDRAWKAVAKLSRTSSVATRKALDEAAVVRAAIESLAENFSDARGGARRSGVALLGLPGIAAYKAINTADSMIGHRTPRHAAFGWAAARLDDLVNLPASRLAAVWLVLAAFCVPRCTAAGALRGGVARRAQPSLARMPDGRRRRMAGALGLRLAGPRVYGTTRVEDALDGRWTRRGDHRRSAAGAAAVSDCVRDRNSRRQSRWRSWQGVHRARLSSRSMSTCASRCAASVSRAASTSASCERGAAGAPIVAQPCRARGVAP